MPDAPTPGQTPGSGIMQQKWFGVPAPFVIIAGVAIAFWLWSKYASGSGSSTSGTTSTPASTVTTTFTDFIGTITGKKRKKKPKPKKPHPKPPRNGTKKSPVAPAAVYPVMTSNGSSEIEEGQISDNPQPAPPDYAGSATTTLPIGEDEDLSGRNQEVPT